VSENKCPKCAAFDAETKVKMRELFGREETLICASSLVSFLTMQINVEGKMKRTDLKRFQVRKDIDIVGCTIGKFMVNLETKDREAFVHSIQTTLGIKLEINHEFCPHTEKKNAIHEVPQAEGTHLKGLEGGGDSGAGTV
jgi:hypothetical protein